MRSRKQLIYLNIKDLTQEERDILSDYDLAFCDNCGEIELSKNLFWIDGEDFYDDEECLRLIESGQYSLCTHCYDKRVKKLAKCNICSGHFIANLDIQPHWEHTTKCPYCKSNDWVYDYVKNESDRRNRNKAITDKVIGDKLQIPVRKKPKE